MASPLTRHGQARSVPQTRPARPDQVQNNAGGYVFALGDDQKLNRFLTIGTTGGTFYVKEKKLTRDGASFIEQLASADRDALIDQAVEISVAGRAPRNSPALFAIAAAGGLGSTEYRARALASVPLVARTGGHLLEWACYHEMFRGWGPQAVRAVRNWYTSKDPAELAFQALKYKSRKQGEGPDAPVWAQRDLIRLAHLSYGGNRTVGALGWGDPSSDSHPGGKGSEAHQALFRYLAGGKLGEAIASFPVVQAAASAHTTRNVAEWVSLILGCPSLSREMLPSEALVHPEVWQALVEGGNLGMTAVLRNLAQMTRLGLIADGNAFTARLCGSLLDGERLRKARVHPVQVLLALKAYGLGCPVSGKGKSWVPSTGVTAALNEMFYLAFGLVKPTGKRILAGIDTSASMTWPIDGYAFTALEAAAAMAMVTYRSEDFTELAGFNGGEAMNSIGIAKADDLQQVMNKVMRHPHGGTNVAAPMQFALRHRVPVDVFRVYTDNETWAGAVHPHKALENYRQGLGIDARLQVLAVSPTGTTVADPLDPRQIDVSGFDSAVPQLLADHAAGQL